MPPLLHTSQRPPASLTSCIFCRNPYDHDLLWINAMQRRVPAPTNGALQPGSQSYVDGADPLQDAETRLGGLTSSFAQHTGWFDLQVGVLA